MFILGFGQILELLQFIKQNLGSDSQVQIHIQIHIHLTIFWTP